MRTHEAAPLRRIAVVVPARDEEELLPSCLAALRRARTQLMVPGNDGVDVRVVIVADRCADGTEDIALAAGAVVVRSDHGRVGAARHQGILVALADAEADGIGPAQTWIAGTDADTVVPASWLTRQVAFADAGYDVLVGTVAPTHLRPELFAAWQTNHTLTEGHPHVHGANLSFRGSAYLTLGGFGAVGQHEDVGLVARLRQSTLRWRATDTIRVATSGRLSSRVDNGFAGYLAGLAGEPGA
ncbi:MAG: glycosyltransferase family A protein [Micrococcales bacterium]|nr:glycosyltransferase family A protein [Micrococcales bacterium]